MPKRFDSGQIVSYPYLWSWQSDEGRHNSEKDRPVCLAISVWDPGQEITHLVILAISGTPPREGQSALEVPQLEIRRANLSIFKTAWITIDEYNYDVIERSFHFDPSQRPRGAFSPKYMEEIRAAIRPMLASRTGRIDRTS